MDPAAILENAISTGDIMERRSGEARRSGRKHQLDRRRENQAFYTKQKRRKIWSCIREQMHFKPITIIVREKPDEADRDYLLVYDCLGPDNNKQRRLFGLGLH